MNSYQAIVTAFKGPTSTQPSRIIARADAGKVTHYYDHGLSQQANHDAACQKLADRLGWKAVWYRGGMPGGDGNVYVQTVPGNGEFAFQTGVEE